VNLAELRKQRALLDVKIEAAKKIGQIEDCGSLNVRFFDSRKRDPFLFNPVNVSEFVRLKALIVKLLEQRGGE